jgi:integrase
MANIKMPSIKIVLRKDKILSNGLHPVCLRVTFNRKPKYYVLKSENGTISSTPYKWNSEIGRFNRNRELNQKIELYELEARNVLNEMKNKEFSFQAFEQRYFKQHSDTKVIPFINTVIEKLKSENRYGTAQVYKDTRNRITEYNAKAGFEDINLKFLQKFERYLIDKGNSTNSISIYMRTLRAAYNKASAEEVFTSYEFPFKKFRIKSGNAAKRSLTKDDILKFINYDPKDSGRIRRSLDYFIFSYLCRGMNLRDMAQLKWKENIIDDKIVYIRTKTANTRNKTEHNIIKIESEIKKILDRYSNNVSYIFPILEDGLSALTIRYRILTTLKHITEDLRKVAKELGVKQANKITHYWARHTYATTLKRSGISTAIISEALGHSSEATTKAYLDKFEQTEIDSTFKHLI